MHFFASNAERTRKKQINRRCPRVYFAQVFVILCRVVGSQANSSLAAAQSAGLPTVDADASSWQFETGLSTHEGARLPLYAAARAASPLVFELPHLLDIEGAGFAVNE